MNDGKKIPELSAPGHTDLMVSPESIDESLEANPCRPRRIPTAARKQTGVEMNDLNIPPCSICGKYHPGYCCVTSLSSFVTSQADIETLRAEAYRAGRIAQAEEDAQLLERRAPETSGPNFGTDDDYTRGEKRDVERICYANADAIRANIAKLKDEDTK